MKVIKLDEDKQTNELQMQYDRLKTAFSTQPKEIQIIISPMLEQLVKIKNIINDILRTVQHEHNIEKKAEALKSYSNLLNDYTSIIEKIMKIINENG